MFFSECNFNIEVPVRNIVIKRNRYTHHNLLELSNRSGFIISNFISLKHCITRLENIKKLRK